MLSGLHRTTTANLTAWLATIAIAPFAIGALHLAASEPATAVRLPQTTVVRLAENLPADGIYPQGRKLAFMGYSGNPARDLTNGFTVAGPVYGNQFPYLEGCFSNGWPVVVHIGPQITFADKDPAKYKVDEPALRREIQQQVKDLADHPEVVWWAVRPEELRPWRGDEMKYLAVVTDAIRQADPRRRPIYHYNPNHRDAKALIPIARQVDVVAKGCYVNSVGRKRDRAWVRWSVEQELEAIRAAGNSNAIALVMPELCRDPEPGEEQEIRAWVRHDVYLGLASGAKGVLIWSLFKRREVARTWQLWYDAYAECARELNGERGLAQVFLFGERRSDLVVKLVEGESAGKVTLGGDAEPATTSDQERAKREIEFAAWTAAEFAFAGSRWLFLINSANTPASFTVAGWPKNSRAFNAFNETPIILKNTATVSLELPPCGVCAVRFGKSNGG